MSKNSPMSMAVHGMDSRMVKMITLFLQGPCGGAGRIVTDQEDADADMFDGDNVVSKKLLEQHLQGDPLKPVIVLSLQDAVQKAGVLHLKKPVVVPDMLDILARVRKLKPNPARKNEYPLDKQGQGVHTQQGNKPIAPANISKIDVDGREAAASAAGNQSPAQPSATQLAESDTLDQLEDWFTSGL